MSGTTILKNGLMAAACVAGLTLTACASGQNTNSSRYGSIYDYEGVGGGCDAGPCGAVAAPMAPVYGGTMIGGQTVSPGVVYADCSVVNGMNCNTGQSVTMYEPAPTTTYSGGSTYTGGTTYTGGSSTYTGEAVACPAGTTSAGDGTCMETGGGYDFTSTTSTSTTYTGGSTSYSGGAVSCPTGTSSAGDGTCMQSSTGGYTGSTTYTGGSTSYSGGAVSCPTGTTSAGDGTCMQNSSGGYTGYTAPTTYVAPTTYLPIRK